MTIKRVVIIAEAGVNHNGSLQKAFELVDAALDAGADIVKFQTFKTENLVSKVLQKADYQEKNMNNNLTQFEMLKELELSFDEHLMIKEYCEKKGIEYLSTPFDFESLDFLINHAKIRSIKIPSGEITNYPLLLKMSQTNLPLIMSTGMASFSEVETALSVLAYGLSEQKNYFSENHFRNFYYTDEAQKLLEKYVTLLHCTTEYPAPFSEVNLTAMLTLEKAFSLNIGYSDHTKGISLPIAAVAMGARIIEKHFTIDKSLSGPDHKASLNPIELKNMVQSIREVEQAISGDGRKVPSKSELKNKNVVRKVLVATTEIKMGEIFTSKNVSIKRAGQGLSPMRYWDIIGENAQKSYIPDQVIEE